jgi:hypothetical protein
VKLHHPEIVVAVAAAIRMRMVAAPNPTAVSIVEIRHDDQCERDPCTCWPDVYVNGVCAARDGELLG